MGDIIIDVALNVIAIILIVLEAVVSVTEALIRMTKRLFDLLYNPFLPRWLDRSILEHLQNLPDDRLVLNVGAGNTRLRYSIVNLDIKCLPNVDVVADAQCLPFKDNAFDHVYCNAVLEHTPHPVEWQMYYSS